MPSNKRSKTRVLVISLALLLIMAMLSACGDKNKPGAGAQDVDLATYKGGSVTQKEFDTFVNTVTLFDPQFASVKEIPEFQEYLLKQMAALDIMMGQVSEESKKKAEAEVSKQMEEIKGFYETQGKDALKDRLKELNITEKDLENYIQSSMVVMTDLDSKVTDEQVQEYYDNLVSEKVLDIATVSHILIGTQDPEGKEIRTKEEALTRANEVKGMLDGGADFAELAKQYSDDQGSKENGGKYENEPLSAKKWVPEFQQAAEELPVNTISDPIETQYGYHIMRVDSRAPRPLDEVKDKIRESITSEQIGTFIETELPNYDFKTNLPEPEAPEAETPDSGEAPESDKPADGGTPTESPDPSASPAAQ
ncbi:peptidylprolyl isomerase [Paenibacillus sp. J2TS4]|uniref:peptidylprolyl isomerase n=1 Tax=Paenibacillus sp. J2TS4 TaxID=2807194 RepID=UPI001B071CA7|nr:peptidylprolyl isomerase [Paenibacillus sp. J2TS4]GIP36338.1 foldase protein PrsA 3 [Paenibacillus sp. J2TS4]